MTILLGIIALHTVVILRARMTERDGVPYGSTTVLSLLVTAFVLAMMIMMEPPSP